MVTVYSRALLCTGTGLTRMTHDILCWNVVGMVTIMKEETGTKLHNDTRRSQLAHHSSPSCVGAAEIAQQHTVLVLLSTFYTSA